MKKKLKLILFLVLAGGIGIILILGTWLYGSYHERMQLFIASAEQSLYQAIYETSEVKKRTDKINHTIPFQLLDSDTKGLLVDKIVARFPEVPQQELEKLFAGIHDTHLPTVSSTKANLMVGRTGVVARTMSINTPLKLFDREKHRDIIAPLFNYPGNIADQKSIDLIKTTFQNNLKAKGIDATYDIKVVTALEHNALASSLTSGTQLPNYNAVGQPSLQSSSAKLGPAYQTEKKYMTVKFLNSWQFFFYNLSWQLMISLMILWAVFGSFIYLFHTLLKQNKLGVLRKAFVNNLTHELRTPVTTVSVALQALEDSNDQVSDKIRLYDIAREELEHLSCMIDKVLQIAEDEHLITKKLIFEEYDLIALIDKCVSSARLHNHQDNIKIIFTPQYETLFLYGDSHHMRNVITNLIENAIKYGADQVQVYLQVAKEDQVTLSVQDNGIGIKSAYHEQVFEPFFRVPQGDLYTVKGFGLGLAYVQQIVNQHGGSIKLKSELHEGSTFTVTIPKKIKK
ncbi:sensor histidine kinase [Sphingobacterium kitahiroshimense]|uniref:histidine kinase n=1 Tax=Sphingobacterium kitahiroshimense TaxID=470446 RepID=A0ABV0BWB3_9SPHI